MNDVIRILNDIEKVDAQATERLLPLIYEELRYLAAHRMAHEPLGQTLQATALVHKAFIRLVVMNLQVGIIGAIFFRHEHPAMNLINKTIYY